MRKSKLSKLIKSIYNFYKKYEWHAFKLKYLEAETYRYTVLYCNTVVSSLFLGIFMDFIKPTVSKVYTHFQTKALSIQIVVMNFILLK